MKKPRWRDNPQEYNRIYLKDYNALRRIIAIADDKCVDCGDALDSPRRLCAQCRAIASEKSKVRWQKRKILNAAS
jgi:uncharacterized OB-fold protein